jgi:class 3 adenylate cyclase/tetratricopeptide (TPR) repeat protein
MPSPEFQSDHKKLEEAIAAQENLRGTVDNAIIDATIAMLRQKLAALEPSLQVQRKLATILFMDIAGHTALTVNLDPEEQMALVDPILARLADIVNRFGGHIARYQGDGFKAVFGLPVAHENDPQQAVRAGLVIQEEAGKIAAKLKETHGFPDFRVRVGISTGLIFAGGETEGKDTIKGAPVNLAARMESLAEPGTVLVSHDTYTLVRGLFDFEPAGPLQVRGFSEPVLAYLVLRARPGGFYHGMRGIEGVETRMIGREAEFIQLQKSLADVEQERDRQLITIIGEAGIGKSRLLYEFENWIELHAQAFQRFKGRARLEIQGQPYGLLHNLFATHFNIQDDDPAQTAREKFVRGMTIEAAPEREKEGSIHILGQLLGYDFSYSSHLKNILNTPRQLRDQGLASIDKFFRSVSLQNPILILFEDLQWADDASLDALNHLVSVWTGVPVLILATSRPGLLERRPNWGEGQEYQRRLQLTPLSKRESRQLVNEVLQKVPNLSEHVSNLIVSNAEGNPFYVEELVKLLIEDRVIVLGETNWQVQTTQLVEFHVPATLTGVLQARLDGLPLEERNLLQAASVIGRVFWDVTLEHINTATEKGIAPKQISAQLEQLRTREFIFHRETSAFTETREYIFKHALLREVAYESVLKRVRQAYHGLVAEWLLEHTAGRTGEYTAQIANHFELAGRDTDAIHYLRIAGEEATKRYANEAAVRHYERALNLLSRQPETSACASQKLDLLIGMAAAYYILSLDQPAFATQSLQLYQEAYALAREMDDKPGMIRTLLPTQWFTDYFPGYWDQMRTNLREALTLSKELQDNALISLTLIAMSARGEITIEQAESSLQHLEEEQNLPLLKQAYFPLIWLHLQAGNYERAIACCDRSIELAAGMGEPPVMYPTFKGRALIQLGRYGQAYDALQDEVTDQSHPFAKAFQGLGFGWYYYHLGAYDKALTAFERADEGMIRVGRPWFRLDALSGQALSHIGSETMTEELLARLKTEVSGFELKFRAVIFSETELYFGRSEEALRLARIAQKQELVYMKGYQVFHYVDGLLLACRAYRQLDQPEALLNTADEGLRIADGMVNRPAAWKFNGLKGWALDRLGKDIDADRAYQAAAMGIRELAEAIEESWLRKTFLTGKQAEQILTRIGDK